MKTNMIKSQLLYHHSFPIHTKTTTPKLSSFNFHSISPTSLRKGNSISFSNLSTKIKYREIRSHKKEEETTFNYNHVTDDSDSDDNTELKRSLQVIIGAASIGFLLVMMGQDKALALGPEGPLVEEFWENVRRYALYALTVSTGVIYSVFQPIVELLKNPISAVLILIIIGGSFFVVSQILSAMVGVSEFSYEYAY